MVGNKIEHQPEVALAEPLAHSGKGRCSCVCGCVACFIINYGASRTK